MSKPMLRFYFDYISTNAYLAWVALPGLAARYGIEWEPIPVLFAGLLEATGQLGPAEVPVKAYWMWKNNLRKAKLLGVPLHPPAFHPFNPLLALRASSVPVAREERIALVDGLLKAVWVDGLHVSEPAVVQQIATQAGLDGASLVDLAVSPESKARLRTQTDAAIAAGVFGVPSMIVGDEVFWGYDDFPYLELLLAGKDPIDPQAINERADPPRPSAMRRRFR